MTRIVYNACYGGFGLSPEAIALYAKLKGAELTVEPYESGGRLRLMPDWLNSYKLNGEYFSDHGLSRTDPLLLAVIDQLGDKANGRFADLQIRELPEGTRYRIDEYDGNELVVTIDECEWRTA